jgi:hypothetical protein
MQVFPMDNLLSSILKFKQEHRDADHFNVLWYFDSDVFL